jgi:hypothetical protein
VRSHWHHTHKRSRFGRLQGVTQTQNHQRYGTRPPAWHSPQPAAGHALRASMRTAQNAARLAGLAGLFFAFALRLSSLRHGNHGCEAFGKYDFVAVVVHFGSQVNYLREKTFLKIIFY